MLILLRPASVNILLYTKPPALLMMMRAKTVLLQISCCLLARRMLEAAHMAYHRDEIPQPSDMKGSVEPLRLCSLSGCVDHISE